MAGTYTLRDTIRLELTLTDPDTGDPIDANDIACIIQPPGDEIVAVPGVVRIELGMRKKGAFVIDPSHAP